MPEIPANRRFTRAELSRYNGQNGMPAYVAVNQTVYDVTTVFVQGKHFNHLAGQDLTGAFLRQHAPVSLSGYPVVGILMG
ncbi:putative heme/steroid binding protein [Hydrogenispora ethanolica]|jgi:predicted heme/steroid binding protein|uniref:Putative heme/steroid binding protein n=1 Tax=Hydrogenispora ethanolica TaxID=1082276 RepID=A0A4R1R8C7_HYDET|nr:cytochrome b5 domain-containing protein [Hydrogenispora ethanolica]TCL61903.1 putative heme/steroid binding protein [Hydrogenispora ethanolica]